MPPILSRLAGVFRRRAPAPPPPSVRLDEVRRRLELLLAAMYSRPIPIAAAEVHEDPGRIGAWLAGTPPHLRHAPTVPSTDGERILLPPEIVTGDEAAALQRYRVLAVSQAERVARGTARLAPDGETPIQHDLYLLLEAAAVDRDVARAAPGLARGLAAERAADLARRPALDALTPVEREVETIVRSVLAADPTQPPPDLAVPESPQEARALAKEMAARVRKAAGEYRGIFPVQAWGTLPKRSASVLVSRLRKYAPQFATGARWASSTSYAEPTDSRAQAGNRNRDIEWDAEGNAPGSEQNEPPPWEKKQRADAQGGAGQKPIGGGGQDEPELEEEAVADGAPAPLQRKAAAARESAEYQEWDYKTAGYKPGAVTVRLLPPPDGDGAWASAVLKVHASTIRRLQEKFERLRARRSRLNRQRDGDEPDLSAWISALVDLRAGRGVDDRLYTVTRPARRGLAILLLVDISGSTSDEIARGTRIIDLEKVALLLTAQALDALGDAYAVLTFSGRGPRDVRMRTVKDFGERNGEAVRRRMGALQPEGYTRLGAAVRHGAALLAGVDAGHRLMLILSDGRPNDEDEYDGRYGIEDSRQAIAEARRAGIYPFCLTVDRKASQYLPRIFGASGHEILAKPEQLPLALTGVVQHLLRS